MPEVAFNIADLTLPELAIPCQFMLAPIGWRETVKIHPIRVDEMAVILDCDAPTAANAALTMRRVCKALRVYVRGPRGGWRKATDRELEKVGDLAFQED